VFCSDDSSIEWCLERIEYLQDYAHHPKRSTDRNEPLQNGREYAHGIYRSVLVANQLKTPAQSFVLMSWRRGRWLPPDVYLSYGYKHEKGPIQHIEIGKFGDKATVPSFHKKNRLTTCTSERTCDMLYV